MAQAMRGVTKALVAMNKKMDPAALAKVMNEFVRENERSEMTMETFGEFISVCV